MPPLSTRWDNRLRPHKQLDRVLPLGRGPFGDSWASLTDEALAMMCERLPAITSLDISYCDTVTDEGLAAAVSSLPALNLRSCYKVTDAGLISG